MSFASGRAANVDRRGSCSRRGNGVAACCTAAVDALGTLGSGGFVAGGVSPLGADAA
jgi:hypothetical protein